MAMLLLFLLKSAIIDRQRSQFNKKNRLRNMESSNTATNPRSNSRLIIKIAVILIIGAIAIVSILRDRIVSNPQWQVSVIGQGKMNYQPDIAIISMGVQIDKASTAIIALDQLNEKTDKIIEALKKIEVNEEAINTQGFTVYTHYDLINNISVATGYDASQQLSVKLKNIKDNNDLISQVINEASKAGANRVDGINFEVSNLEELKQQARLKAITDAKSKASVLADAAGIKLKKIVGWWENIIQAPGINQQIYFDGKGGGGASSGSIPNGQQEIIIDMNVSYQIK